MRYLKIIFICALFGALAAFLGVRATARRCERIAKVTEVFNDSTYAIQTIDLCHGPVR